MHTHAHAHTHTHTHTHGWPECGLHQLGCMLKVCSQQIVWTDFTVLLHFPQGHSYWKWRHPSCSHLSLNPDTQWSYSSVGSVPHITGKSAFFFAYYLWIYHGWRFPHTHTHTLRLSIWHKSAHKQLCAYTRLSHPQAQWHISKVCTIHYCLYSHPKIPFY